MELNHTIFQLDIIDTYRVFHPSAELTLFSSSHGTCTKTDHILGHKTHLNKFKRIEIIQCLLSNHNGIKLEITNKKMTQKSNPQIRGDYTAHF